MSLAFLDPDAHGACVGTLFWLSFELEPGVAHGARVDAELAG